MPESVGSGSDPYAHLLGNQQVPRVGGGFIRMM